MYNRVKPLTRRTINKICDAVLPVPSLDRLASEVATNVVRERIRNQLVKIELDQRDESVEMLTGYMLNRQRQAFVKDDTNLGLPTSEATSSGVGQTAMSSFKATSSDISLTTIVGQMSSSLSTVIDRSDQKVFVHFNPQYATGGINYSLREVADMRGLFVRTTLGDVLFKDRTTIGVIAPFEGDGLDDAMNKIKKKFQAEAQYPALEPGKKNRARALKADGTGIVCMRLYIDSQLAYSRGISMHAIVRSVTEVVSDINCSVMGSSLQDGIVDILSRDVSDNLLHTVASLERIKSIFPATDLAGISSVDSMALERVNIPGLIVQYSRASPYFVAQLGMGLFIVDNRLQGTTWLDLENECYLVSKSELRTLQQGTYTSLGWIGTTECIYMPDYGGQRASSDDLTELYIAYYCNVVNVPNLNDVWVLRLNIIVMKAKCVEIDLIRDILDYCGIEVLREEVSRTSPDIVEYIYVYSAVNPQDTINMHFNSKSYYDAESGTDYTTSDLSDLAKSRIDNLLANSPESMQTSLLQNIETQYLDRMSKYYYAVLSVARKGSSNKEAGPIIEHVASHTYSEILRFPFVSREKTTCNDWFTMNYVLGSDGAKNNYILEPVQLFAACDIKIDPRHLDLIADYVYERGEPSGVGLVGMKKHSVGFTHEMSTQNTYSQLYSGHTRAGETVESYSISTYFGVPPVGVGTKQREVEQARRIEEMDRSKNALRRGRVRVVLPKLNKQAQNSDAVDIAVRSMFIDTDPYYGIPTIHIEGARLPEPAGELIVSTKIASTASKIMSRVLDRVALDVIVGRLDLLREYTGHIKVRPVLDVETKILDMVALGDYFTQHASFFS